MSGLIVDNFAGSGFRFLSVCSGIEAASVAWNPLGWRAAMLSEIEPFPCAVLAHHYPDVPNVGDMTGFKEWPDATIDLLVGGTPCQSFSVAGLRKGLADPRGNLALTYLAIAERYRPRWVVWENVPGVLSSEGGGDFASFLGGLGELGYGWAYRVLDAQYFGVAQRRRRVFVVGCLGGWACAGAVLFESDSLRGRPPARRSPGQDVAGILAGGARSRGGYSLDDVPMIAQPFEVANTLTRRMHKGINTTVDEGQTPVLSLELAHTLRAEGFDASEDGTGRGTPLVPVIAPCLTANYGKQPDSSDTSKGPMLIPIAFDCKASGRNGFGVGDVAPTLRAMGHKDSHGNAGGQVATLQGMRVRRLTPREGERLQGFPDDYTLIPWRGRPASECPDGPRYKALGNSMAVPVMRWIGQRIAMVERQQAAHKERVAKLLEGLEVLAP